MNIGEQVNIGAGVAGEHFDLVSLLLTFFYIKMLTLALGPILIRNQNCNFTKTVFTVLKQKKLPHKKTQMIKF